VWGGAQELWQRTFPGARSSLLGMCCLYVISFRYPHPGFFQNLMVCHSIWKSCLSSLYMSCCLQAKTCCPQEWPGGDKCQPVSCLSFVTSDLYY
jgi:hypothetical protein